MMTCGTIAKLIMDVSIPFIPCVSHLDLFKEYGASNLLVNMCALSFLLMFVPGNFMTIYVINRYGFRKCVRVSCISL